MKNGSLICWIALSLLFFLSSAGWTHDEGDVEGGGLVILATTADGPAATAGVQPGDRLLEIGGVAVESVDELAAVTRSYEPGATVPVRVERGGAALDPFSLTFGDLEGRASLGVQLAVMTARGAAEYLEAQSSGLDGPGCLDWVDEQYPLEATAASFDFDLGSRARELRVCLEKDLEGMPAKMPVRWCDNAFKVHCSGLDLLTSLGEAQVEWCESTLATEFGIDAAKTPAWTRCAADRVFDRFSTNGESSDAAACRQTLADCGFEPKAGA